MAHKALQQCLLGTEWGELDYLLIDLPPGTGDVHITLVQTAPLTGAVLVSTPQDVGLTISLKTLRMFEQTRVHPLGMVENMSYYACSHCGEREDIFGHGEVRQKSEELGIPFLGEIPLDPRIRAQADLGVPIVIAEPQAPSAQAYQRIAELVAAQVSIQNYGTGDERIAPREIRQASETELAITWGDGHASTYPLRYLRLQCPCAVCVDEWTHERRLDAAAIPPDVQVLNISPVGNYAVRFDWSDGHNTGIYGFDRLRDLCQCADCTARKVER
jgi:ATP-binding protein involved in chromosome partitioning